MTDKQVAVRFREAMNRQRIIQTRPARVELGLLAAAIASDLAEDNDRFDRNLFLRACGIERRG